VLEELALLDAVGPDLDAGDPSAVFGIDDPPGDRQPSQERDRQPGHLSARADLDVLERLGMERDVGAEPRLDLVTAGGQPVEPEVASVADRDRPGVGP
jgi:hypothetical protein